MAGPRRVQLRAGPEWRLCERPERPALAPQLPHRGSPRRAAPRATPAVCTVRAAAAPVRRAALPGAASAGAHGRVVASLRRCAEAPAPCPHEVAEMTIAESVAVRSVMEKSGGIVISRRATSHKLLRAVAAGRGAAVPLPAVCRAAPQQAGRWGSRGALCRVGAPTPLNRTERCFCSFSRLNAPWHRIEAGPRVPCGHISRMPGNGLG